MLNPYFLVVFVGSYQFLVVRLDISKLLLSIPFNNFRAIFHPWSTTEDVIQTTYLFFMSSITCMIVIFGLDFSGSINCFATHFDFAFLFQNTLLHVCLECNVLRIKVMTFLSLLTKISKPHFVEQRTFTLFFYHFLQTSLLYQLESNTPTWHL